MADKTKKTTSKKTSSKNKPLTVKKTSFLKTEIIAFLIIVFSIILAVSLFTDNGSVFLSKLFGGLFGIGAYIIPFSAIAACGYILFNKNKLTLSKYIVASCLLLSIITFFHLITRDEKAYPSAWEYIKFLYVNGGASNGGVIGGIIGEAIYYVLRWGSYILVPAIILILSACLTGKSLAEFFSDTFYKIKDLTLNIKKDADDLYYDEEEVSLKEKKHSELLKKESPLKSKPTSKKPLKATPPLKPLNTKHTYTDGLVRHNGKVMTIDIKKNHNKGEKPKISFILDEIGLTQLKGSPLPSFLKDAKPSDKAKTSTPKPNIPENNSPAKEAYDIPDIKINDYSQPKYHEIDFDNRVVAVINKKNGIIPPSDEALESQEETNKEAISKAYNPYEYTEAFAEASSADEFNIDSYLITKTDKVLDEAKTAVREAKDALNIQDDTNTLNDLKVFDYFEYAPTDSSELNTNTVFVPIHDAQTDFTEPEADIFDNSLEPSEKELHEMFEDLDEKISTSQSTPEPPYYETGEEPVIIQAEEQILVTENEIQNKTKAYEFPKISFLKENPIVPTQSSKREILENSDILIKTLKSFNIEARVTEISKGPTVTRYEIAPGEGIKVSKILGLSDNLALSLAAQSIRIEAPIPGKAAVGIEIPNKEIMSVYLREVICDQSFQDFSSNLAFGLGKDIAGNVIVKDIAKMPHLLIAGSTGSGKSVCINTLITDILYKASPDNVRLIMIDPKVVELSIYDGIPHLLIPVVTDPQKASGALNWAVSEMMNRYNLFSNASARNLEAYNKKAEEEGFKKLPQIVIIIDELADLMMVASKEVESSICRLAQLARAAGIHLIIATQRPSVDVITGLIKTNIPSRIAFAVSSVTDSRTILDHGGAEKLLGKGDMLLKTIDMNKALRIQGAFISDSEIEEIVAYIKEKNPTCYDEELIEKIENGDFEADSKGKLDTASSDDDIISDVIDFIVKKGSASTSMIQRRFRIGYNRAARIIDELEERGIVGPETGTSKPRSVLMDKYQWREYKERQSDYI